MDQKIPRIGPNYHQLFFDIIEKKCPNKMRYCKKILNKKQLDIWDITSLNKIVFPKTTVENRKFKSYTPSEMKQIIQDQNTNKLTYSETSKKYEISMTTIRKWRNLLTL